MKHLLVLLFLVMLVNILSAAALGYYLDKLNPDENLKIMSYVAIAANGLMFFAALYFSLFHKGGVLKNSPSPLAKSPAKSATYTPFAF